MVSSRDRILLAAVLFFSFLAGCSDDPSNIGLGFIDAQAGEPFLVTLEPTTFETGNQSDITGGFLAIGSNNLLERAGANRFLVGSTLDPEFGMLSAEGRLNFVALEAVPDEFRNGTVSTAVLQLDLDYMYGDTLSPITLSLLSIDDEWSSSGTRGDTLLAVGTEIMQFDVFPTSGLIDVELPDAWVTANNALLRSESFSTDFHGFHVAPVAGDAIVGFRAGTSRFRLDVPGDTVRVDVDRILSTTGRSTVPTSSDLVLLQDGLDVIEAVIDFDNEAITNNSVHSAFFRLNTSVSAQPSPAGYYRPPLQNVALLAITGEENFSTELATGTVDDDGILTFQSVNLNVAMQNIVLGKGEIVRFEILAPVSNHTVNSLFVERTPGATGPRLVLTLTEVIQ